VIGVPSSLKALREGSRPDGEDIVMLDQLGAGMGSLVGVSEGVEAAMPFHPTKKPVDAYCACILDQLNLSK
jgi:ethanolamine utilization protein EutN